MFIYLTWGNYLLEMVNKLCNCEYVYYYELAFAVPVTLAARKSSCQM